MFPAWVFLLISLYLAGPMTGYAEHNFPAFAKATADLRAMGYAVVSPAEEHPVGMEPYASWDWNAFLRADLRVMLQQDMVALLPQWYISRGASLERETAIAVGIKAWPVSDFLVPAVADRLLRRPKKIVWQDSVPVRPAWEEEADTCVVGSPRPNVVCEGDCCPAEDNRWLCTLPEGHTSQHVASGTGLVRAVWKAK